LTGARQDWRHRGPPVTARHRAQPVRRRGRLRFGRQNRGDADQSQHSGNSPRRSGFHRTPLRRERQRGQHDGHGQDQGIHTGISSGRTEGYNRIVKHVGPIAFGFRNTANQPDTLRLHPSITPGANQNPEALLTPKTPTVVAIQIRRRRVGAVTIQRTPADGAADGTEPPHGKATSSVATDA